MKSVTVDTNMVDDPRVVEAAQQAGFDIVRTTVTDRELESWGIQMVLREHQPLYEPPVLGESRLGSAVLGSQADADTLERLLQIISNGSFPAKNRRSSLSPGERRQLRDAMILLTHIRERRQIFVTNDAKGFIQRGRRERLQREFGTKIMTADEFLMLCECQTPFSALG
jgi:hypothetical protein